MNNTDALKMLIVFGADIQLGSLSGSAIMESEAMIDC